MTLQPNPSAVLQAYSPTVPDPIITTSVGESPAIPPNINPLPKFTLLRYSEAINIDVFPAISPILLSIGNFPSVSIICSIATDVISFFISSLK